MAYEPQLEANEKLIGQFAVRLSKKVEPFCIAVSDKALYWPGKKLIALTDPYYFTRIPHNAISEISVRRLSPYAWWILAGIMILAGLFSTYYMMEPVLREESGVHHLSGKPIAVFVGGILMPFAARGRYALRVLTAEKRFKWKPPLVVDRASKNKVTSALNDILQASQQAGLRVLDDRHA